MNGWLLTIWMIAADGQVYVTPVGIIADETICDIAGKGFEAVLTAEDPAVTVTWKCEYLGASA